MTDNVFIFFIKIKGVYSWQFFAHKDTPSTFYRIRKSATKQSLLQEISFKKFLPNDTHTLFPIPISILAGNRPPDSPFRALESKSEVL